VTEEWLAANSGSDLPVGSPTNRCVMGTIVFQSFVFMQLFNQVNSRDLKNELNVLKGVEDNWLFCFVLALTFVV